MKNTLLFILFVFSFCNKREFLTASPSSNFEAPATLNHCMGLLNNAELMSENTILGELSADDYYLDETYYDRLPAFYQKVYTWEKDPYSGKQNIADWNLTYSQVLNCNIVLETLDKLKVDPGLQSYYDRIKGSALFMRSFAFFNLSQVFAAPYDASTASQKPGVVLVLSSGNDVVYSRASLQQSYNRIIDDLLTAVKLLPSSVDTQSLNLPNKPTAYALLSRIFLSMRLYEQAGKYADSCLSYQSTLVDFRLLNLSEKFPLHDKNEETFYQSNLMSSNSVIVGRTIFGCIIDSTLYRSYDANDLRKEVFFMPNMFGQPMFRSNYKGANAFSGLAVNEMLLVRAECNARAGKLTEAINDINLLLEKRYKTGTYTPYALNLSQQQTISLVKNERRKELFFRGLRWSDIRRYNMEEAKITLYRSIAGRQFELLPNDNRFVLPVPDDALMGSNIVQNPR